MSALAPLTSLAQSTSSSIDNFISLKMKESRIVGIGAAIVKDREVVWAKGYGFADKENKIPFTPNSIMNLGGISKSATAFSVMKAVQDGIVELDEDINNYLPFKVSNPFYPDEKITIRQIITNTSSIVDRSAVYDSSYYYGGDAPEPLGEFVKNYLTSSGKYYDKANFLDKKPGSAYKYSNIASGLVAYIVEVTSGIPFNEYSKQTLFDPLEMHNTGWFYSEIDQKKLAKLYDKKGDSIMAVTPYGLTTYPDGGLRTSVSELSKFMICLMNRGTYQNKTILKTEFANQMLPQPITEANLSNSESKKITDGFYLYKSSRPNTVGGNGYDPGVRSRMWFDTNDDIGVIVFSNTSLSGEDYKSYFMDIYHQIWKYALEIKNGE